MKLYIATLLSLFTLTGWAQPDRELAKLSRDEKLILRSIKGYHLAAIDSTGIYAEFFPKDDSIWWLGKQMSVERLLALVNHEKPTIRLSAFRTLVGLELCDVYPIVKEHLQDTARVYSNGHSCLTTEGYTGDFFVEIYRWQQISKRNAARARMLDSLLIFEPNKLEARIFAMNRAAIGKRYYAQVRQIIQEGIFHNGIVMLAKYQNEQDVDLILSMAKTTGADELRQLSTTFFAMGEFPHPAFMPFLQEHIHRAITTTPDIGCSSLYRAIANYNNKNSHQLLLLPFQIADKKIRTEHLKELGIALKMNTDPLYDDLRVRLKGYSL